MDENNPKGYIYCGITFVYIFFLYGSIPFVREIQKIISRTIGRALFTYVVIIFFIILLVFGIRFIRNNDRDRVGYLWLCTIFGVYTYLTIGLWKIPEEAVHFVQYGILGALIFRALSDYIGDATVYLTGAFVVFIVGVGDELIQWITPNRYFDFRDIGLNFIGGALMLVAIWFGIKPKRISESVSRKSIFICTFSFSVAISILGLCLSVTPSVAKTISNKIPMLAFVEKCDLMMPEYGKRHVDPEVGIFFSKFSVEELRKLDDQVSEKLSNLGNDSELNTAEKAFLGEVRGHLKERDRLFREVDQTADSDSATRSAELAVRENRILEKYFGKTLGGMEKQWSIEVVRDIQQRKRSDGIYVSPVRSTYFTAFSLKQAWIGIAIILGFAWASYLYVYVRTGGAGVSSKPVESL